MSYTGIYSVLFNKKGEEGVEIKNWKGFVKFIKEEGFAIFDSYRKEYIVGDKLPHAEIKVDLRDLDEKPRVILFGFRCFKCYDELFNIGRLAYYYDKEEFIEFWRELSRYTEPFWFLHSTDDGFVPTLFEAYLDEDYRCIVKVECDNGKIKITEVNFKPNNKHIAVIEY